MPHLRMLTVSPLAAAGACAALGAGIALPAAAGARSRGRSLGHTITVVEHAVTDTEQRAVGRGKDEPGDPLTFTNPVFDAANRARVGHDEGFCMRLNLHTGAWECLWTTFLPHGQITVQGPYYDTRNSVLAITGGTGAYRNARGQMKLVSRDGGKEYDFIFQLS
ncbi:MAG TPA: allene oxide cyclase family protein [Solirubrobacteraceae bacterium]|nr:allene oxide cyclase family protein [Solirubrobacteraceae bacterium]